MKRVHERIRIEMCVQEIKICILERTLHYGQWNRNRQNECVHQLEAYYDLNEG